MNKKISVVISVWNGENYLSEAIKSALNQTYNNKEIIVVNDGSTDKTKDIIQKYSDRIIAVFQENKGLGAARNVGIKASSGEYFAFLDHDDLWPADKLLQQIQLMETQDNDPFVFMHVQQFICKSLTADEKKKVIVNESILPGTIAGTLLLSKKRFYEVGFFEESKQLGEYLEWYLRALSKNIPTTLLNSVGLYRRIHKSNMGRRHDLYSRVDYLKILKADLDRKRALYDI